MWKRYSFEGSRLSTRKKNHSEVARACNFIINLLVYCYASDVVGNDRRRLELSNAPLDGSPRYDNHGT